jgi:hypothetical protein
MRELGFIIHYGLRAGRKKKKVYWLYLYKFMLFKLGKQA